MDKIKDNRGGKRVAAGRPSLKKKNNKKLIALSDQAVSALEYYSGRLGISMADVVDTLCVFYLDKSNSDILHCPKCGNPIAFMPLIHVVGCDAECVICGEKLYMGEENTPQPPGRVIRSTSDLDEI
jgi:hypothetical protein